VLTVDEMFEVLEEFVGHEIGVVILHRKVQN
jgi:methionine aminopeptidase